MKPDGYDLRSLLPLVLLTVMRRARARPYTDGQGSKKRMQLLGRLALTAATRLSGGRPSRRPIPAVSNGLAPDRPREEQTNGSADLYHTGYRVREGNAPRFRSRCLNASIWLWALFLAAFAQAQGPAPAPYVVKPLAEMKLKQLPDGPLYWRIENFPTLAEAKAAANTFRWNPDTVSYDGSPSLVAEVAGKVWLFTLGPKGGATPGASKVAEVGPVPPIEASEYLLRVNHGSGPPGSKTRLHSHPGSEAFYVVAGRLGQRTPHGVNHAEQGQVLNGHSADVPMEVFNSGESDLTALIMFVVDASRPFSVPVKVP